MTTCDNSVPCTTINTALFVGKWKGIVGGKLCIVEIDSTKTTNELVGWLTFIGNEPGERSMFTSIIVKDDLLTLTLREQLTIRGWVTNSGCSVGSQILGNCCHNEIVILSRS